MPYTIHALVIPWTTGSFLARVEGEEMDKEVQSDGATGDLEAA